MAAMTRRFGWPALLLALTVWFTPAFAEPNFPALSGRVVDAANILSAEDEAALTAELKALEDKASDQLVVVTLPSLQDYPIEDYGYQLGRRWGIGTAKLNNGVLLIVAPNERKVRIEVGRGLEPILTDALSRIIIENAILPRFRTGDFAGGIKDGVRDITLALTGDAAELEARARARPDANDPAMDWLMVFFWIAIILLFIWASSRSNRQGVQGGRRGGSGPIILPSPGWGGGGSSGSSGGGFSGGGGSFGGGGASGGW